ncbi:MAG: ATP-binding protein [Gammaproteobacteria bacterium]|jgi:two-component system sensor histidine kinase RegB
MQPPPATTSDEEAHKNLRRLFLLRNFTIFGVALGITVAISVYALELPLTPLAITTGLLATLNALTWLRLKSRRRIADAELFAQMLLDVAGLSAVFYFTGGAGNPFVWFYLLPLMIAATILPRAYTWAMAGVTIACYSALFLYNQPLPHAHTHPEGGFQMHVFGMWLGFVISAGFVAVIIVGMAHSLRERDRKLAEAREQALQNEQLVAMGTLATGAAHELGTPLGTMAILISDLEKEHAGKGDPEMNTKLAILGRQIARCKEALAVISASAGANRAEAAYRMPVKRYLEEVISEWQSQRPAATLEYRIDPQMPDAEMLAERTLTQALINILNNAADASPEHIRMEATCSASELMMDIVDQGPGLQEDLQLLLGKRPVSTKPGGLGVGLFLAQATIQRLGGRLSIRGRAPGGTLTRIALPLLMAAPAAR